MGKPKVIYFQASGRAAGIRLVLTVGGVEFDDERISGEEFAKRKAAGEFPFGSLPCLEIDGKVIPQTASILRYAAKLAGSYPSDPVQAAFADAVVETLQELIDLLAPTFRMAEEEKIAARKTIVETQWPKFLNGLNKIFAEHTPLLGGDKPNYADLQFYAFAKNVRDGSFDGIATNLFDAYPALTAALDATKAHPLVAPHA